MFDVDVDANKPISVSRWTSCYRRRATSSMRKVKACNLAVTNTTIHHVQKYEAAIILP